MNKIVKKAPYPSVGECLRLVVGAIDAKSTDGAIGKKLDRMVKQGDFDWCVTSEVIDKLLVAPLREIDPEIPDFIRGPAQRFKSGYVGLLLEISLDGVERSVSLPVLVEHLFVPNFCWLLLAVKDRFGGPEIFSVLTAKSSLGEVVDWLEEYLRDKNCWQEDDELKGYLKAIRLGRDLPSLMRLKLLKACLIRLFGEQRFVYTFLKWILLVRAMEFCARRAESIGCDLLRMIRAELLTGLEARDIGGILSDLNYEFSNYLDALRKPALELHFKLNPLLVKSGGDQCNLRLKLDEFKSLVSEVDRGGNSIYWVEWCEARWHVLSGQSSEALSFYENALRAAVYRAGANQKAIIREGMVLAAYCGDKVLAKRFKQQGIAFGLFSGIWLEDNPLYEWEMEFLADAYGEVFPKKGHFPEGRNSAKEPRLPFLMVSLDDVRLEKPDLRSPDRIIKRIFPDGQERRYPQLVWFASFDLDAVQRLISAGASVDKLDSQGGSALLNALQCVADGGGREVLDYILNIPHRKETVNARTKRKKTTPLLCAIELGDALVVSKLIAMGAEADLRGTADQTPLYLAIEKVGLLTNPEKNKKIFRDAFISNDPAVRELRRVLAPGIDLFGELIFAEKLDEIADLTYKKAVSRYAYDELFSIVIQLVEAGADPNGRHEYPVSGRTPLMLAAEDDAIDVFKFMVERGGDPWLKDDEGLDCFNIAFRFKAGKVSSYLRAILSQQPRKL